MPRVVAIDLVDARIGSLLRRNFGKPKRADAAHPPARVLRCDAVDPDLQLVERWRNGDQRASQELFARHFASLYRFFEHKAFGEADDLVQNTFTNCYKSLARFESKASFRTYLFSIARNELYMWLRKKRPAGERVDLEVSSLNEIVSSPSSQFAREQQKQQLISALRTLSVEQQTLLELHYWHDVDAAGLAEIFGTTTGAIRTRLVRARLALRDRMRGSLDQRTNDPLARSLLGPELDQADTAG